MPIITEYPNCNCCGGGIDTDCCNGVNTTLTATFTNKTGTCTCLPSTVTLTYNVTLSRWGGSWSQCGIGAASFFLRCVSGTWELILSNSPPGCSFNPTGVNPSAESCDPFQLDFTGLTVQGCCAGTVDITITE